MKKQTNLEKEKSDFSSGLKTVLILAKKDRGELLQKYAIFTVKPRNGRILQSKKNKITDMSQFIFCLIIHLLVTQKNVISVGQEFMLKIV